jgi:superfamily I DNA/RNA helicase
MRVRAVEGSAGCGKTYRLMEFLVDELQTSPLAEGQRVLALTFMHGARRRLADRLNSVVALRRRFDCVTIDSFAWRLLSRWQALAQRLHGEIPEPFDARCDMAGALLERPGVCAWVVASFPIIVIDEAQDLRLERLRMVRAWRPARGCWWPRTSFNAWTRRCVRTRWSLGCERLAYRRP